MIPIRLTTDEILIAANVGMRRHARALHQGLKNNVEIEELGAGWNGHIEGACGEMAVAKALGLFWGPSINGFRRDGDVSGLEVKTTRAPTSRLLIRKRSPDGRIYVLVTGEAPDYVVCGWKFWRRAEALDRWKDDPGGIGEAWFIPQRDLEPISTLRAAMGNLAAPAIEPLPVSPAPPPAIDDDELAARFHDPARAAGEELAQLDFDKVVPIFPKAGKG